MRLRLEHHGILTLDVLQTHAETQKKEQSKMKIQMKVSAVVEVDGGFDDEIDFSLRFTGSAGSIDVAETPDVGCKIVSWDWDEVRK